MVKFLQCNRSTSCEWWIDVKRKGLNVVDDQYLEQVVDWLQCNKTTGWKNRKNKKSLMRTTWWMIKVVELLQCNQSTICILAGKLITDWNSLTVDRFCYPINFLIHMSIMVTTAFRHNIHVCAEHVNKSLHCNRESNRQDKSWIQQNKLSKMVSLTAFLSVRIRSGRSQGQFGWWNVAGLDG